MRLIARSLVRPFLLGLLAWLGFATPSLAQIGVPLGFALDPITTSAGAITRIAVAPPGFGAFEGDLFAVRPGTSDLLRIDPATGAVSTFATLSSTTAGHLAFGPGGAFGTNLYVSEAVDPLTGNTGLIERVDALGNVSAFGAPNPPPGPPSYSFGGVGLAFSLTGPFGEALYSGTAAGQISDSLSTLPASGGSASFFADFGSVLNGSPLGLAFGNGGGFGDLLYVAMNHVSGGTGVEDGIYRYTSTASRTALVDETEEPLLAGGVFDLAFSDGPTFGRYLFACVADQQLVRVDVEGVVEPFVTNLAGCANLAFAADGSALYFVETTTETLWRLAPLASPDYARAEELVRYREDFEGESGFPVKPEFDDLWNAGLAPSLGETFTGDALRLEPQPTDPLARVVAPAFTVSDPGNGLGAHGLRVRVALASGLPAAGESRCVELVLQVHDGPIETLLAKGRLCGVGHDAASATPLTLEVEEAYRPHGLPLPPPLEVETETLELPSSLKDAIASGASVSLDLRVDHAVRVASATVERESTGELHTVVVPLTNLASLPLPLDWGGAYSENAVDFTSGPTLLAVDIDDLEIYQVFSTRFVVDTNADEADASIGDGVCSAPSGLCSLRAAIQEANAVAGAGRIDFAALPSALFSLSLGGLGEDASATGDLDVLDDLEIQGLGREATQLIGAQTTRVLHVPAILGAHETVLHVRDLTIVDGDARGEPDPSGGGLANAGNTTLERTQLSSNVARIGGGLFSSGRLQVLDSWVRDNEALDDPVPQGARGGGIAVGAAIAQSTPLDPDLATRIRRSAVFDNDVDGLTGSTGGIHLEGGVTEIENTTVSRNSKAQLYALNNDVAFRHTTVDATDPSTGHAILLDAGSPMAVEFDATVASAVLSPACILSEFGGPMLSTVYGTNAGTDSSCGFVDLGDLVGSPLPIDPLVRIDTIFGSTWGHVPNGSTSPLDLLDSLASCGPRRDQTGAPRPTDSDGDGTAGCDIGAIEAPEPGTGVMLLIGSLALAALPRKRWPAGGARGV